MGSESINYRTQKAIDGAENAGSATGKWVGKKLNRAGLELLALASAAFCGAVTFIAAATAGFAENIKGGNNDGRNS